MAERNVSVVIPAHNGASSIAGTLASISSETSSIKEVIVVDDSSMDDTGALAQRTGEKLGLPVRVIRAECRDAGGARNVGLTHATSRWIYFLDADDHHTEGGLRRLLLRSEAVPEASLIIGAYVRQVDDGSKRSTKLQRGYQRSGSTNAISYLTGRVYSIAMGSALVARSAVGDIRFPTGLPYDEDTLFWARVLRVARVTIIDDVVLTYAVSNQRANDRFIVAPNEKFQVWRRALGELQNYGIPFSALAAREGLVALKIARVHYAKGDFETAAHFLTIANAAPKTAADRWRCMRYAMKIAIRRKLHSRKPRKSWPVQRWMQGQ
jgi:glycosyltransferase involved in cell wall biosynthesis